MLLTLLHYSALALLLVYAAQRGWLTWLRRRNLPTSLPAPLEGDEVPDVLVQLPLYNEASVAARVIRAAASLDWPCERLHVQVLDDSTDETSLTCARVVRALRREGVQIVHVRRAHRDHFKAGALAEGLRVNPAPLVALFDADFLPPSDFLRRSVPALLADPKRAMVQARWGHLNAKDNLLTRAQALLLDGHFVTEQAVRAAQGSWFNFNGTAGLWRRSAIDDAGGWQGDTLTEDLDLSYRAQLRGWHFAYLPDLVVPAELPARLDALLSQQERWSQGGLQTLRKLGSRLLRAPVPFRRKAAALLHLSANAVYPLLLVVSVTGPLLAWPSFSGLRVPVLDVAALVLGAGTLGAFYGDICRQRGETWPQTLVGVPLAILIDMGLAWRKGVAAVKGARGLRGEFVRTPKRGSTTREHHALEAGGQPLGSPHASDQAAALSPYPPATCLGSAPSGSPTGTQGGAALRAVSGEALLTLWAALALTLHLGAGAPHPALCVMLLLILCGHGSVATWRLRAFPRRSLPEAIGAGPTLVEAGR